LHVNTHTLEAVCELFPAFRRLQMLRNWGGIVDVTPDRSPIIAKPVSRACMSIAAGEPGDSKRRRVRRTSCLDHCQRRAAPHQRAVHH